MAKFNKGDIVIITDTRCEGGIGRIENWRGGRVAPYVVRVLKSTTGFYKVGEITYLSGRDMELKDMCMSGKKKVWCCHAGCNTYSFEDRGILKWECFKHYPNSFNNTGEIKECEVDDITLEQKVDLLLEHLGVELVIEPQKVTLKAKSNGKKTANKKR
jgi:hypothetical protein